MLNDGEINKVAKALSIKHPPPFPDDPIRVAKCIFRDTV